MGLVTSTFSASNTTNEQRYDGTGATGGTATGQVYVNGEHHHLLSGKWTITGYGDFGYNYCKVIYTITTDSAGANKISFSCSGSHGETSPTLKWKVTSSRTTDASSGMTTCSHSASNANCTWSGTININLLPNTTYYVLFYAQQGTRRNYDSYPYACDLRGTMTFSATGTYGAPGEITANNTNFDSPINMSYGSATAGGAYTVTVQLGSSAAVTLQTQSGTSSRSWTPSLATYGASYPNQASVNCVITVSTYFGGTLSGTKSKTVTVSFTAAQAGPSTSNAFSIAPQNEGAAAGLTGYIQGYSKIRASFNSANVTKQYGASVAKWTVKFGSAAAVDVAAGTATKDSGIVSTAMTVTCTVTDSRGFTASETYETTIIPYENPALTATVKRTDASGQEDDAGTYLRVDLAGWYSDLDGQNTQTSVVRKKLATAASYDTDVEITGGTTTLSGTRKLYSVANFHQVSGVADAVYDVQVEITDRLGNKAVISAVIESQHWALHFRNGGAGAAFGKAAERDSELDIGSWKLTCGNIDCNNISTIDGWTVVEWGNGLIEAHKKISGTLTHYATAGPFYGYWTEISLPVTMRDADYFMSQMVEIGNGFTTVGAMLGKTTTSCRMYALATQSGTQSYVCVVYIRGFKA